MILYFPTSLYCDNFSMSRKSYIYIHIHTFEWLWNILLQLLQIKLFPNNKMGKAIPYLLFPWCGWVWERLTLHWPGRRHRSRTLACHLWMSRSVIPLAGDMKVSAWSFLTNILWSSEISRFSPSLLGAAGVQDGVLLFLLVST